MPDTGVSPLGEFILQGEHGEFIRNPEVLEVPAGTSGVDTATKLEPKDLNLILKGCGEGSCEP